MINMGLAERQGLTDSEILTISILQDKLQEILYNPESLNLGENDTIPDVVRAFEFVLQYLWKFPCDSNFHRYQNRIKGCLCPAIDNKDMIGTKYRYVNGGCPLHGDKG